MATTSTPPNPPTPTPTPNPTPNPDEVGGYYFNSAQLIARKTKLARSLGLAGVMIWEVGNGTVSRAVRAARET